MINLLGFDAAPYCVIYWQSNGEDVSKTVCYTPDDEKWALDRFHTQGDFYSSYDNFVVEYDDTERKVV